jgi:hexulose-6-phosphate isomerase
MPNPLNRRDILKLSAAALAAGTAVTASVPLGAAEPQPTATPAAAKAKRPLKKAYFGLPSSGSSLVEKFKILKEAGFDGLQLNMPDSKLPVEEVAEALKASGLQLEGTCDSQHWRLHLSDPDPSIRKAGLDSLMESMRQSKQLGGTSVLLVPGVVNERWRTTTATNDRRRKSARRSRWRPSWGSRSPWRTSGTIFISARWKPRGTWTSWNRRWSGGTSTSAT